MIKYVKLREELEVPCMICGYNWSVEIEIFCHEIENSSDLLKNFQFELSKLSN